MDIAVKWKVSLQVRDLIEGVNNYKGRQGSELSEVIGIFRWLRDPGKSDVNKWGNLDNPAWKEDELTGEELGRKWGI